MLREYCVHIVVWLIIDLLKRAASNVFSQVLMQMYLWRSDFFVK